MAEDLENKEPVIFNRNTQTYQSADWHRTFERVDECFQQINHRHAELCELQRKLETTIKHFADNNNQSIPGDIEFAVGDLTQLTRRQSAAIEQLDNELGNASEIVADSLTVTLAEAIAQSAEELGLQVRFQFSNQVTQLDRKIVLQISHALEPLLKSIVSETIEDAAERTAEDKPAIATIEVSITETQAGLFVEVADNGAGVSVQGGDSDYQSPWSQASKSRLFNTGDRPATQAPSVWSRLSEETVDIDSLLKFAARYGGTVAVSSDGSGSSYCVSTPYLTEVQDVLLLEVETQKFAIAASDVKKVGLWEGGSALSIAELMGIGKKSAFEKKDTYISIDCISENGLFTLLADKVIGHQSLEITKAGRVFPSAVSGYSGVAIDGEGDIVMLLDVDYWVAQRMRNTRV